MKKLNKKQKKQIASIAAKKDADIDLSDMPEVLDWSKAEIGKFYRPTKKPVTIRLDRAEGQKKSQPAPFGPANASGMQRTQMTRGKRQRTK
jgi:hypothetical protein